MVRTINTHFISGYRQVTSSQTSKDSLHHKAQTSMLLVPAIEFLAVFEMQNKS